MYKAAIHTKTIAKQVIHKIVYGRNPSGPRGGHIGNFVDAISVTDWYAGRNGQPSEWMRQACAQLNSEQIEPEYVKVVHEIGSKTFKVKRSE